MKRFFLPPTPLSTSNDGSRGSLVKRGLRARRLRPSHALGLRLAAPPCQGVAPSATPLIVQYPDIATLRCLTGLPLADGIVLQDPAAGDALVRDWTVGQAVPPTRHFGYAAQWFMFALVLSYFFVRLNLRNSRDV